MYKKILYVMFALATVLPFVFGQSPKHPDLTGVWARSARSAPTPKSRLLPRDRWC